MNPIAEIRRERVTVLFNRAEVDAVNALARVERLPVSTMARRLLLEEAERRNLLPRAEKEVRHATE